MGKSHRPTDSRRSPRARARARLRPPISMSATELNRVPAACDCWPRAPLGDVYEPRGAAARRSDLRRRRAAERAAPVVAERRRTRRRPAPPRRRRRCDEASVQARARAGRGSTATTTTPRRPPLVRRRRRRSTTSSEASLPRASPRPPRSEPPASRPRCGELNAAATPARRRERAAAHSHATPGATRRRARHRRTCAAQARARRPSLERARALPAPLAARCRRTLEVMLLGPPPTVSFRAAAPPPPPPRPPQRRRREALAAPGTAGVKSRRSATRARCAPAETDCRAACPNLNNVACGAGTRPQWDARRTATIASPARGRPSVRPRRDASASRVRRQSTRSASGTSAAR